MRNVLERRVSVKGNQINELKFSEEQMMKIL